MRPSPLTGWFIVFPQSLHRAYSSDASRDREGAVSHKRTTSRGQSTIPLFLQTFRGDDVAHALMRAASALMPTPGADRLSIPHQSVERSLASDVNAWLWLVWKQRYRESGLTA